MSQESRTNDLADELPLALSELLAKTLSDRTTHTLLRAIRVSGDRRVEKFARELQKLASDAERRTLIGHVAARES